MQSSLCVLLKALRRWRASGTRVTQSVYRYLALISRFLARKLRIQTPRSRHPSPGCPRPPIQHKHRFSDGPSAVVIAPSLLPTSTNHSNHSLTETPGGPSVSWPISEVYPSVPAHGNMLAMHSWHHLTSPAALYTMRNTSLQSIAEQNARLATIHANTSVRSSVGVPAQQYSRAPGSHFTSNWSRERSRSRSTFSSRSNSRAASPLASRVGTPVGSRMGSPANRLSALHLFPGVATPPVIPQTIPENPGELPSAVTVQSPSIDSFTPGAVLPAPIPASGSKLDVDELPVPEKRVVTMIYVDEIRRYQDREHLSCQENLEYLIDPVTTKFPHSKEDVLPDEWTPATHPDGALYFYHGERRIYTDAYLYNSAIRDEIEQFAEYMDAYRELYDIQLPSDNCDLVLNICSNDDSSMQWRYYYVDHDEAIIFWVHEYPALSLISTAEGASSPAHIRHRLEDQFWSHWYMYPAGPGSRKLPDGAYEKLLGILTHGVVDVVASPTSTTPYSAQDMQVMSAALRQAKDGGAGESDQFICSVGRLLGYLLHWRFLYFHGQRVARLDQGRSLHGNVSRPRSLLITLLSPILFYAPELHLTEIEKLWADKIIVLRAWNAFITRLQSEWQEFVLYSTVMLTVDVGFLAIPNVILGTGDSISTSPAQIASSLSILFSIGSIVVGLLLVRHNRTRERDKQLDAVRRYLSWEADTFTDRVGLGRVHATNVKAAGGLGAIGHHP
ncbi:hypothetical protein BV25DRAFT_1848706 [Artomyces pyxidatus]|uniref:Uncharacterized protein n=1 Tax=Artomyces pyxidatus TaxID=48021 RepID=A0ACB8TFE4_9AGAM|nr:hypothetical protein BV25DRAFT_1848706 [Artomyces pyxidatus]